MTTDHNFQPHLLVITRRRVPHPILPVDYSYFLSVELGAQIQTKSLEQQLVEARAAVQKRRSIYRYDGPFGTVFGYKFRCAARVAIFLNAEGDYDPWASDQGSVHSMFKEKNTTNKARPQRYVVGRRDDGFTRLLPETEGNEVDESNFEDALSFNLLSQAVAVVVERGGSVFEVVEGDEAPLRELLVDLRLIAEMPFGRCYGLGKKSVVGPALTSNGVHECQRRVTALRKMGVTSIVNLLDRPELLFLRRTTGDFGIEGLFESNSFPISDGSAPSVPLMKQILDTIDQALSGDRKVYLHCYGGRGRSGTVAGCLIARHGVATGVAALNHIVELRYEHGLFTPSPETMEQEEMVTSWEPGE